MAQVTAALVKQLREMTDSPMMECKKALVEADGDIEKAVDILRTMGVAKAVKRAGRDTNEGTIAIYIADDSKTGAILELTCETDFVGTNPKFTGFATDLAKVVAEFDPSDVDALKACPMANGTVADELTEMIHVIGENMACCCSPSSLSLPAASGSSSRRARTSPMSRRRSSVPYTPRSCVASSR